MSARKQAADLCICGHRRDEHEKDGDVVLCYGCDDDGNPTCDCDEFDPEFAVSTVPPTGGDSA